MKTARYLLNGGLLATLGLGAVPVITHARRVGQRSPRPCLAKRAYWTGQGPFPLPLTGRFSTGARACPYLTSGRSWRGVPCAPCYCGAGSGSCERAGVRWGRECRGARALLTGLDPHPAPTPPTIQYPSPVPGYPICIFFNIHINTYLFLSIFQLFNIYI